MLPANGAIAPSGVRIIPCSQAKRVAALNSVFLVQALCVRQGVNPDKIGEPFTLCDFWAGKCGEFLKGSKTGHGDV